VYGAGPAGRLRCVLVAAVQFVATTDKSRNLERITELVGAAARRGAQLVVVPEAAMHDFGAPDLALGPIAEPLDGPFVRALGELAERHGTTIVAGMFEASDDAHRPYNTVVVAGPEGRLVGRYRKVHLYDSFGYRESDRLRQAVAEPTVVPVGEFTVGLMTCYDLRFPEFARALVDCGADVLVVPSAWVRGPLKEAHWTTLLQARAIENTAYVVAAGQTGSSYVGCSMILDPLGVTIASLGDEEGFTLGELTGQRLSAARERNPSLANRRIRSLY
jgi:deaminated glutathione amidase